MKSLFSLFIVFTLVLGPLQGVSQYRAEAADGDLMARTAERAFLSDLRERIKDYMDFNLAYLSGLEDCLSGQPTPVNCNEVLGRVLKNTSILYPKMRKHLLLISLLHSNFIQTLVDISLPLHLRAIAKGRSPTHRLPLKSFIKPNPLESLWGDYEVPSPDFTQADVENLLTNDEVTLGGTHLRENLNGFLQKYCAIAYGAKSDVCSALELRYDNGFYFATAPLQKALRAGVSFQGIDAIQLKSRGATYKDNSHVTRQFYEIIQTNPYVALVSSAKPSGSELLLAIKIMKEQATNALKEYEIRRQELLRPDVSDGELLRLMEYGPIAASVLETPGENMQLLNYDYDALFEVVQSEHSSAELKRTAWHIGLLIGANVVFCVGGGRALKYLFTAKNIIKLKRFSELFNPLCFPLTTIPVNGWFVYDSIDSYDKTFQEVFASADGAHYLREVHALSDADRSVFISILFSPIGAGTILKNIARSGLKFSKPFLLNLEQRLLQTRGP
jgi:hypothetical protein